MDAAAPRVRHRTTGPCPMRVCGHPRVCSRSRSRPGVSGRGGSVRGPRCCRRSQSVPRGPRVRTSPPRRFRLAQPTESRTTARWRCGPTRRRTCSKIWILPGRGTYSSCHHRAASTRCCRPHFPPLRAVACPHGLIMICPPSTLRSSRRWRPRGTRSGPGGGRTFDTARMRCSRGWCTRTARSRWFRARTRARTRCGSAVRRKRVTSRRVRRGLGVGPPSPVPPRSIRTR
mmetsp:Transcript_196/g.550  ORF Transcript_196/g.550 Transcript_196/m.550 type:complete len:230 (+) Transcript_196:450-1139(+)